MLPPEAMVMSSPDMLLSALSVSTVLLNLGSVLMSKAYVITKGHLDVPGLDWSGLVWTGLDCCLRWC